VATPPRRAAPRLVATEDEEEAPAKEGTATKGGSVEGSHRDASITDDSELPDAPEFMEWFTNTPLAISKTLARQSAPKPYTPMPKVWDWAWDTLPFLKAGAKGEDITFGDTARTFKANIEQLFAGYPSRDGAPLAAADVSGLDFEALFLGMKAYFDRYGSVFKMCFGPKSFLVVSDPVVTRRILRENNRAYDKGALAVVLEDIMGKGLIPADPETWAKRRRAIAPAFHKLYLERMVDEFRGCAARLADDLEAKAATGEAVDLEERFGSVALDIVGKAVFNYDFQSTTEESPVVKAAIRTLGEVEHRALTPLAYWKVPGAKEVLPRLVEFEKDMDLLNNVLYDLIDKTMSSRDPADLEALQNKDYSKVKDPSMLRFLVDLRGEEVSGQQMRDDLITLLIAGHETTAAVLTWATYELCKHPEILAKARAEVDRVVGDCDKIDFDQLKELRYCQNVIAEALRMYPAPPLLIRRSLDEDTWPEGGTGVEVKVDRASDLFISLYNMGRSPQLWDNPDTFDPDRWERKRENPEVKGWGGYDPSKRAGLYPSEVAADFAFIPFGGGERKCVGDQFATLESLAVLAVMLRRLDFALVKPDEFPGMKAAATIHTSKGLMCTVAKREM